MESTVREIRVRTSSAEVGDCGHGLEHPLQISVTSRRSLRGAEWKSVKSNEHDKWESVSLGCSLLLLLLSTLHFFFSPFLCQFPALSSESSFFPHQLLSINGGQNNCSVNAVILNGVSVCLRCGKWPVTLNSQTLRGSLRKRAGCG